MLLKVPASGDKTSSVIVTLGTPRPPKQSPAPGSVSPPAPAVLRDCSSTSDEAAYDCYGKSRRAGVKVWD